MFYVILGLFLMVLTDGCNSHFVTTVWESADLRSALAVGVVRLSA